MAKAQNIGVTDPTQTENNGPLYLGNSDVPSVSLISVKLTWHKNYRLWSFSMRLALLVKNKLGFVDGTFVKKLLPKKSGGTMGEVWCCGLIMVSAIVAPDLVMSIIYASNSQKNWNDFWGWFDEPNLNKNFHLWKKIGSLTQGIKFNNYLLL